MVTQKLANPIYNIVHGEAVNKDGVNAMEKL